MAPRPGLLSLGWMEGNNKWTDKQQLLQFNMQISTRLLAVLEFVIFNPVISRLYGAWSYYIRSNPSMAILRTEISGRCRALMSRIECKYCVISTSYLTGLFDIFRSLSFGDFLPIRTLCDACHKEFESI